MILFFSGIFCGEMNGELDELMAQQMSGQHTISNTNKKIFAYCEVQNKNDF